MASTAHSYGPNCTLQPESNLFTRRASTVSDEPPKIRAQFFYSSTLPIDDPLSPIPPPLSATSPGSSKVPPQPFSVHDNNALEQAWQTLHKAESRNEDLGALVAHSDLPTDSSDQYRVRAALTSLGGPTLPLSTVENLTKIIRSAHERRLVKLEQNPVGTRGSSKNRLSSTVADGTSGTHTVVMEPVGQKSQGTGDPHLMLCDNPDHIPFDHAMPIASDEIENEEFESGLSKKRHRSPFRRHPKTRKPQVDEETTLSTSSAGQSYKSSEGLFGGSPSERDTTGTPFLRVPERLRRPRSRDSRRKLLMSQTDGADSTVEELMKNGTLPSEQVAVESRDDSVPHGESEKARDPSVLVPVGVSRLHMVEMPNLTVCEVIFTRRS